MPERMYWKQEIRKRVVFSEFSMLDFCFFTFGGINLNCKSVSRGLGLSLKAYVPRLSPYGL